MEICANVHQIDVLFDGRIVCVYLLLGERPLLIDSGVVDSPERRILPYLARVGLKPYDLWGVVNTHTHTDHCGGNYRLKQANPKLQIMAHERECADVAEPTAAVHRLFDPYRHIIGDADADVGIRWNMENLGPGTLVDRPLRDEQRVWPQDDWPIEVYHTPGHTAGHLALYDPHHRLALIGDAIGWKGTIHDGRITQFPLYRNVDAYLDTIHKIRSWPLDYLCTSHYSTLRGDEISDFLRESETFVVGLDRAVKRVIETGTSPDLRVITEAAVDMVGGDYVFDICAVWSVDSHLRRLRDRDEIS